VPHSDADISFTSQAGIPIPQAALTAPTIDPAQRQLASRLAGLSLFQQVVVLSVWPLLEQVLNFLVTFVDTVQSGHLNASAVAAVGIGGYIIWIVSMIQSAVAIGATAIIARAAGAGDRRLLKAALGQSLVLAAVAGVAMGAALFLLASPISEFVEFTGRELEYSTLFLRVLALATPVSFVLFVGCACLRGAGDTATPFRIMLFVNIVNVAANYAFVLGPAPIGGHGVAGIAAATDLAWTLGALSMVISLLRGKRVIRLYLHRLLPRWDMIRRVVRVGIPNLVEASGFWIAQFVVLKIIGHVGRIAQVDTLALHSVAVRVEALSYLPGYAMSTAAATLAGQYLGIGDPHRARRAVQLCWYLCMVIMGTMGLLFVLVPRPLIAIVTDDPGILRDAPTLLRICGPSEVFMATYLVLSQAMRGAGDTRMPMLLSYCSIFCVRVPAVYIVGLVLDDQLVGIWFALCGEVVFRGVIFAVRFWKGGWLEARV
jgi:putative MATE family efflux protein